MQPLKIPRFQEEGVCMPRRSILSAAERASLLLPPDTEDELIRHYAFGEPDLSLIRNTSSISSKSSTARWLTSSDCAAL